MYKPARCLFVALCTTAFLGACADTPAPTEIPDDAIAPMFDKASPDWTRMEIWVDNPAVYVDCLGENVHFYGWVPIQWHQVTSASGNYNYHFQYRPVTPKDPPFYAETESGTLYLYKNGGPINESFHEATVGSVYHFVDFETYVAVDSKDSFKNKFMVQVTVNANGDLTAEHGKPWEFVCTDR